MKAIDIIKAMCYDSNLAQFGQVNTLKEGENTAEWCSELFDAQVVGSDYDDHLTPGDYLTIWQCDINAVYPFDTKNIPDFVLERIRPERYAEDDRMIYLWRIQ